MMNEYFFAVERERERWLVIVKQHKNKLNDNVIYDDRKSFSLSVVLIKVHTNTLIVFHISIVRVAAV